ncbi:putative entry exclusion protein TrbK-alt [Methylocystis sp. H62]|uniref:putative entry exclusion protein TrbK-alt n=1 Tax=Methylocystis sp. H62 TaxID=2785789 RepID=UPI0018C350A2|nr:putative entry exclusion protein TrbK-alt [Methylocystis sp. H62]MBG0794058.1 putative entry exclusion protein TrbK-alt [Methylocystis sp. H62]
MKIEDWIAPENIGLIALGVVIGAIALVGVEAACDADVAARAQSSSNLLTGQPVGAPRIDEELLRCATLPIEQADDPKCRALWAEQRRKFFGPPAEPAEEAAKPLDMFPSAPRALEKPAPTIAPKASPAPKPSRMPKSE